MTLFLKILFITLGYGVILSFFGACISCFLLLPFYDDGKEENWLIRYQYAANPMLSRNYYRKEGWRYWHARDRFMKVLFICFGILAILSVVAAMAGIKFE